MGGVPWNWSLELDREADTWRCAWNVTGTMLPSSGDTGVENGAKFNKIPFTIGHTFIILIFKFIKWICNVYVNTFLPYMSDTYLLKCKFSINL